MLSIDKPLEIDGITVFRDFDDQDQFWYLPGPVALARDPRNRRAKFSFIKYRPAVAGAGVKGGGFAMFEMTLGLPDRLKNRILAQVMTQPGVQQPRLSPVIFEQGRVECIALDLQGSGGTVAADLPPGAFKVTQQILGATTPSLDADNRAAFSLTLSQEGAIILEQAFQKGLAPVGVLYNFTYTGMRPALKVEITADLEMIFNHFSASLEAQYQWVRAGIDAAFESLRQNGAITIKVVNANPGDDKNEHEKWALDFFKNDLLSKWFVPTFTPGQLATKEAQADPLASVAQFTRELRGEKPPAGGGATPAPAGGSGQPASGGGAQPAAGGSQPTAGGGQSTAGGAPVIRPAVLTPTNTTPSPLPEGRSVTHTPSTSGTTETIRVTGEGAAVRAGGAVKTLDNEGKFTLDVAPGAAAIPIEVEWPAVSQLETFHLFFDFDEPIAAGWSTSPPSPPYRAYVEGTPQDDRFQNASGIADASGGATWTGAEVGRHRFTRWLQTLAAPRTVEVDAHASFETAPQPGSGNALLTGDEQSVHNMRLSMRRQDVAVALIARANASLSRAPIAHGDSEARGQAATNPPTGDPNDRVVRVRGRVAGGQPSTYRGSIQRPASTVPPGPNPPGPNPPTPNPPKPAPPAESSSMPGVVSLQLKFIRQEERKRLTLTYNRAEAVRRTYAPQGFFGLMLRDLEDKDSYFIEVDLDDPFFREFEVMAEAPVDFARIGLSSAQVALDYGDPANAADHKHGDFVFRADDKGPKEFVVFMSSTHDVDYQQQQQFHFSPDSGWDSDGSSVELPAARTEDRTLFVNPYDVLDFLEITVTPGDLDPGVIDSTEVTLEATGPGTFQKKKTFVVLPNSKPQVWKLRAPKPVAPQTRVLTYALTHHLKDGTKRVMPAEPLNASTLVVHDPFPQSLNLEFIPLFDAAAVRQVFVDVEYSDPINAYARNERLDIKGNHTDNVKLRLAILDPAKRDFRFRFTFVGTNNEFQRLAWVTSSEELIPVRP